MADILVRGMEMPKGCFNCDFCSLLNGFCYRLKRYVNESREREKDCPLLPFSEGHGKLGDLDTLEENLRMMAAYQTGERQQGILGCCETIRMTKPIVPAEEGMPMATREELYKAVRLLSKHCRESSCYECALNTLCHNNEYCIGNSAPTFWPDPEEGGNN